MNRLKAPEQQPRALPVGAGLSTSALLSSALLGAASLSPQRDYSFSFWQEIPEVKNRGLLEGLPSQQRHLQEVPEKGISWGREGPRSSRGVSESCRQEAKSGRLGQWIGFKP